MGLLPDQGRLPRWPSLMSFQFSSAPSLLGGTLPLRHCAARFASKVPTWRLLTFW